MLQQWSSRGKDVHIVDAQPSQLSASVQAIENFRAELAPNGLFGKIVTHKPDTLSKALKDAWLVVEVSSWDTREHRTGLIEL